MSAQETKAVKAPAAKQASTMPEFLRKFVVGLKRSPQTIPLVVLVIAFLVSEENSFMTGEIVQINGGQDLL